MNRLSSGILAALLLDVALLGASFLHVPDLLNRARSPFILDRQGAHPVIDRILDPPAASQLSIGDTVVSAFGRRITSQSDMEFLCDCRSIGESMPLEVRRAGGSVERAAILIPYFSPAYVLIVLLVGFVTWSVGIYVLLARPSELAGAVLHAALICMAVSTMHAWGQTAPGSSWALISRGLYFLAYPGVAATFCYFTTLFPRPWPGPAAKRGFFIFIPALVVTVITGIVHIHAIATLRSEEFEASRQLSGLFHLAIVVYVGLGIWNCIRAYVTTASRAERKKLQWVLFACSIGPAPFLCLVVIPELFIPVTPVPEELALIFLIFIPVAFAISFVKYGLLDIDVVIKRTTVYALAVGSVLVAYAVLVGGVTYLIGTYTIEAAAMGAVAIALAFEPARRRVQKFVDRRFFRVEYDFRQAERRFVENLKKADGIDMLGEILVGEIEDLMPVERLGFFVLDDDMSRVHLIAHRNFTFLEGRGVRFSREELRARLDGPVGIRQAIEEGVACGEGDPAVFNRWGLVLVIPMLSQQRGFLGFLGLGPKRSSARFSAEDIDLLVNISAQAGLDVERIGLQQQVAREQAEALRQKTLNDMKTEFVRLVTHELKTPLTAIKLCAELLKGKMPPEAGKAGWCLETIEGETDRLDRMVSTMLVSARIEREAMTYEFEDEDLGGIVSSVLVVMQYQLQKDAFTVETSGLDGSRTYPVRADRDAVAQVMINLISNAIKYSAERKYLKVAVTPREGGVECAVTDHGVGISPEALPYVFEKYYRDPANADFAKGIGLGLPLVKHIMESHHGTVCVESTPGEGSTFTVFFPSVPLQQNHQPVS
jgi:signal transduction histidine kinase